MVGSVQAHMQYDFAAPHAGRRSVGEDKVHGRVEIVLWQVPHIGSVPVIDVLHAARERLEIRHFLGSRRMKSVRLPSQVMLKDPIDDIDVVENAEHDRGILFGKPVEILANHIVEAALGPLLVTNEL